MDGSLDDGFGSPLRSPSEVYQVSLEPDGSLLVGGVGLFPIPGNSGPGAGLVRLDSTGRLHSVYTNATDSIVAFLAGSSPMTISDSGLMRRFLPDGSHDPEFRVSSMNLFPSYPPPIAASGNGYFGFGIGSTIQGHSSPGICRFLPEGSVDRAFRLDVEVTPSSMTRFSVTAATALVDDSLLVSLFDSATSETRILRVETRSDHLRLVSRNGSTTRLGLGVPEGRHLDLEMSPGLEEANWTRLQSVVGDGFDFEVILNTPTGPDSFFRLRMPE